jgi:hypothetical protein
MPDPLNLKPHTMGTYIKARLIKKDEGTIKKANESIRKAGYPTEYYEGVEYGFFISKARLKEDARFMNEDEEGLKQQSQQPRPITMKWLTSFFWNEIGAGIIKITGCGEDDQRTVDVVQKWLLTDDAKQFIDFEASENIPQLETTLV